MQKVMRQESVVQINYVNYVNYLTVSRLSFSYSVLSEIKYSPEKKNTRGSI